MKSKTKAGGIVGAVVAVGIGASMLVSTDKSKEKPKPGYAIERQSDGKYTVYYDHKVLGKDLNPEQADQFLDKKKGRKK